MAPLESSPLLGERRLDPELCWAVALLGNRVCGDDRSPIVKSRGRSMIQSDLRVSGSRKGLQLHFRVESSGAFCAKLGQEVRHENALVLD